jgi:hypothetical protein
VERSESAYVRDTQIEPVAGVWACDNCGRRIQVVTGGDKPKVQSFICVCGTEMRPGDEHLVFDEDDNRPEEKRVVDQ